MAADDDRARDGRLAPQGPRRQSSGSPLRISTSGDDDNGGAEEERILLQDQSEQPPAEQTGNDMIQGLDGDQGRRPSEVDTSTLRRPSQQRVRFSTDIERGSESDSHQDTLGDLGERPVSRSSRIAASGLTVETGHPPLSSQAARLSPSGNSSPVVSPSSNNSPISPPVPSPASRSRGYSLRRTLFNRNLHQTNSPVNDTSIELGQNATDRRNATVTHSRSDSGSSKGEMVEIGEVSSSNKDDDSAFASERTDTLKGVRTYRASRSYGLAKKSFTQWILSLLESIGVVFREHVLRIKPIPPSKDGRHIDLDAHRTEPLIDERTGKHYISNYIRSSRYSLWSFFPKQFIAQFSKLANFYFLVIAILQMIPGLSTTGTFTTFVPLMIFVGISMGKEGFDDFRRYRLDKEENNRLALVLRPNRQNGITSDPLLGSSQPISEEADVWAPTKWIDIQVGDVIRLERDQPAPADLVLLHAEEPNGIAYIETMALDGETNLKSKKPCIPVAKTCATIEDITANKSTHFAVEDPNIDLYKFDGNVTVAGEKLPLTNNEVIYRGSVLRNTHEAIGMVIYTGEECKIRMNANKNPRIKAPALQAMVNRVVAVIVLFVVVLSSACTIAYRFWSQDVESKSWYLEQAMVSYGPVFTSFLIMFNTLIPISLYVSLEIVKVAQMFLLNDIDMYDEDSNTPLEARTSTINEELGQVSYIFSDKTGTLTNNSMRFRKMSVAGTAWLHDTDLNEDGEGKMLLHKKRKGKKATGRKSIADEARRGSRLSRLSNVSNLKDRTGVSPSRWRSNRRNRQYHVTPAGEDPAFRAIQRSAVRESIDVWLRDRETDGGMDLRQDGNENYSPRPSAQFGGRASFAYSDGRPSFQTDDGEDLVEEALVVNEAQVFERCFQHLNDFATEGLRTLLYGYRYLTEAEYKEWKAQYMEAVTSLSNRQEKIEEVGEQIENQFELLGATAIEDKLQKGVPEAIDKLRRANIKLWMLTGDKRETALNIGHSCRLVKDYSSVIIVDDEAGKVEETIRSTVFDIQNGNVAHSVVVVDGQTLSAIEADPTLEALFFDLAILADSVICCRASPKQKAFLVRAIRKRVNKSITLAIGDGANDIAMIQEAHVGIGITGKEGLQAARISDYSIAQFRFLLKLLLVHGRWNYIRVCKYTLGTFWKETLFYLTQALYQRWNGYTGTSLYEPWSLSMFNTLFTSLPVIFLGIFEKDLAASTLLAVPELYTKGQLRKGFNIKIYLGWAFMGSCEAMIVYFVMYGLFGDAIITKDNGVFALGLLTYSACVTIISAKLQALEIHNHSVMAAISTVLSVGGWFLWNLILSDRYQIDEIYNVRDNFIHRIGRDFLWWTTLFLSIVAVILFEIGVSTVRTTLFPTDVDMFQEYEQDLEIRKRFEEAAAMELQQGWDRGTKKSSAELQREAAIEAARELQVQELLDRRTNDADTVIKGEAVATATLRPNDETEDVSLVDGERRQSSSAAGPRRSLDIHEMFSKGFGSIRKGPDLR
ncbi:conserved hypothetical protein [Uncinocarpus reesii 1704]|uniref:Phospholipid-transporting ATPase n=1 Tax=Uncinocarpus reesii (strain UAMH 1704) TaxID=336963 RepID=C4JQ81_UNCRE|nr:uncharacterized protein UREG_03314 [Uncinocarpus reesii 1704]EEP78468.1 conserved hypothetical protein [Uncinocarpus reesii 1704]